MKFLHTSDWHIGRGIRGQSRMSEQEAALQQVLTHAREESVDCVLVAGDVFDTSAPAPEAERLVYEFFRELYGAGIPAVVIAGNHDHPRRLDAVAPLLTSLGIHARGMARGPADGALIEVASRDGRETAVVAALPWVNERDMVDFGQLQEEMGAPLVQYAERVRAAMRGSGGAFRPRCDQRVGGAPAGRRRDGRARRRRARAAHGDGHLRRAAARRCPTAAQYIALGHVHKNQEVRCGRRRRTPARCCSSTSASVGRRSSSTWSRSTRSSRRK